MTKEKRCAQDGASFEGESIFVPVSCHPTTNEFTFANLHFCSPGCAKGYLFRDAHSTNDRIHLFHIYCRKVLGIDGNIQPSPDPIFLKDYMVDPTLGLSIEEFRNMSTENVCIGTKRSGIDPVLDESIQYSHVRLNRGDDEDVVASTTTAATMMED